MSTQNRDNEDYDIEVSQNEIVVRDHCIQGDSWEHAIGYLMYVADFPTRTDMDSVIFAMNIAFPDRQGKEQSALYYFRENMKMFLDATSRLSDDTRQQLIDKLHFDFSQKIKIWLEQGIVEKSDEDVIAGNPSTTRLVSGADLERLQSWHRRQRESKDTQAAAERMARREAREKKRTESEKQRVVNKVNGKEEDKKYNKTENGKYIKKRPPCLIEGCNGDRERYRHYCAAHTKKDEPITPEIKELLDKYYPQRKVHKPIGPDGHFLPTRGDTKPQ
jgi:hypothetical protein